MRHKNYGAPLAQRILNVSEPQHDGCWLFTGSPDSSGYGRLRYGGTTLGAHRASYMAFVGPIPDDMTVDHLCFEPLCVNPEHLELLSMSDNAARQRKALAGYCQRGHEFTEANTHWQSNNHGRGRRERYRLCRTCRRQREQRRRASSRGDVAA